MSDVPFYRTQMGHRFFQATVPGLVRELARLNDNLERLAKVLERDPRAPEPPPPPLPEEPR